MLVTRQNGTYFGHPVEGLVIPGTTGHAGQWRCKYPDAVELEQALRVEEPGSIPCGWIHKRGKTGDYRILFVSA
jgi:hypothetical protein